MNKNSARLLASAFIIGCGGVTTSLGLSAKAQDIVYGSGGEIVGSFMIIFGAFFFLYAWFAPEK